MISDLLRRPKQLAALFKQAEELWRAAKGARVSTDEALLALLFLRGGSSLARLKATIVALSGEFLQDEGRMFLQAGVSLLEDFEEVVTGAGVEGFEARSRRVWADPRGRGLMRRGWRPSPRASARSSQSFGQR